MGEKTSLTLKIIAASLFTMLLVVFMFTDTFSFGQPDEGESPDVSEDALIGTADGHNGVLKVAVTMDGDTITDVQVIEHSETDGLADPALEQVPAAIVDSNSTDVDIVSGATVTSNAIMEAVANALGGGSEGEEAPEDDEPDAAEYEDGTNTVTVEAHNGPLTVEVTVEGGVITNVVVTEHSETEGLSDPAIEDVPAAIVDSNSPDVDTVSGATVSSEAIIKAVKIALGLEEAEFMEPDAWVDGTYTGSAKGFGGDIAVEVAVEGGVISNIVVSDHSETEGISDPAFEEIPAAMMEENSTNVDIVSGATYSSNGIIDAVRDALKDAQ